MKTEKGTFIRNVFSVTVIAGMLLCCIYALHDMQMAEGIGLYFTLKVGMAERIYMDVLVDVLGIVCLVVMILLPCVFIKRSSMFVESYCRLLIGYLAIMPSISLAAVLHMFHGEGIFLWDGNVAHGILQWFLKTTKGLQIWLPLLIFLYAMGENVIGKYHRIIWFLQGCLLVASLLVPAITPLVEYFVHYFGLILAFDCWEAILCKNEKLEKWSWIIFVLLLFKGIYQILILVSGV